MGMYSWFTEQEFEKYSKLDNIELDELLQEIREVFPQYYVIQREHITYRRFRKNKVEVLYSVLSKCHATEAKMMLLPNQYISANCLMAFFYGILNGAKIKEKR